MCTLDHINTIPSSGRSVALSADELIAFLSLCAFDVRKSVGAFVLEPADKELQAVGDCRTIAARSRRGATSLTARGLLGQPAHPEGAHDLVALPGMLLSADMVLDLRCLSGLEVSCHWRFASSAGSLVAYHQDGEAYVFCEMPGMDALMQQVQCLLAPLAAVAQPGTGTRQALPVSTLRKLQAQWQRKAFKTARNTLVAAGVSNETAEDLTSDSPGTMSWLASLSSRSPRNRGYRRLCWVCTVHDQGWLIESGSEQGWIVPLSGEQCQVALLELIAQIGQTNTC